MGKSFIIDNYLTEIRIIEGFDCDIVLFDIDANDRPSEIEYINRDKKVIYDAGKHRATAKSGR